MARAGLGKGWRCLYANDLDPKKAAIYQRNWGEGVLHLSDVAEVAPEDLPGRPDLVWASFPCQDLSLAGAGGGLGARRSGAFWPFWRLMQALWAEERGPRIVAIENVCGAISSHGGRDFQAIAGAFAEAGLLFGAMVIDGARFLPQSRPRLFVIGVDPALAADGALTTETADPLWSTEPLRRAAAALPPEIRARWRWWRLPEPARRNAALADLLEPDGPQLAWRSAADTRKLLAMMDGRHREKVERLRREGARAVGALYRRTRRDESGAKVQRAEARFDGLAGCLRTPAGGSSRQTLIEVSGGKVRSRLLTPRETARLMGLDDAYILPERATEAYHLTGDGVVAPAVRHLAEALFEPLLSGGAGARAADWAAE